MEQSRGKRKKTHKVCNIKKNITGARLCTAAEKEI
jgi:hypothetical protein